MKKIQVPATLTSVRTLSDGGLSVGFHTQELTPEEKLIVMEKANAFGWLLFKDTEEEFSDKEIPKEKPTGEFKTTTQRLNSVLFVWWNKLKELNKIDEDFDTFRRRYKEKIIEQIKVKISELEG